jgi:tetratricopeptide (TPR) repeat protein
MIAAVALAVALVAPAAEDLVAQGQQHYRAGNFADAAAAFAEAHATDPRPEYLYRWAQAERRAGNCPVAAQLYRRYLGHDLPPENAEAARKNLARCGYTEPGPAETALDTAGEGSAADPPVAVDEPPPPTPPQWWRDPLGTSFVVVGGALVVTGIGLGIGSARQLRLARAATVEDDYIRHAGRLQPMRIAAIVTGSIGAALLVGGIVRWALVARGKTAHARAEGLRIRF